MSKHDEYAADFAASIIKALESNTAPWQKGWDAGHMPQGGMAMPYNAMTGKSYKGSNAIGLFMAQQEAGYDDNRWMTYNQAQAVGAQVRKGETGVSCARWVEVNDKREGKVVAPGGDDDRTRMVPVLFKVFNATQIDGLAPQKDREAPCKEWRHSECERLIKDSGAVIHHDGGDQAFYRPSTDDIHLPVREAFHSGDAYYSTVLHELGHQSGHPSRLARDLTGKFGSESYAKEELRAEIFSMRAGQELGIGHSPDRHVAYVKHWVKILQDDPKEILRACAEAEKICAHVGIERYKYEPMQITEAAKEKEKAREEGQEAGARKAWKKREYTRKPKEKDKVAAMEVPWSPTYAEAERISAAQIGSDAQPERKRDRGMEMTM